MDHRQILESQPLPLARGFRRWRKAAETREEHDAAYYLFEVHIKYAAAGAIAGSERDHKVNAVLKGPRASEPLRAGFATAEAIARETRAKDGLLDIRFVPGINNPLVSAIEVERLE
jgi:hypothetical protein